MKITGTDDTIQWYNQNAQQYADASDLNVDQDQIEAFVSALNPGSKVLDAGCGAGRDTALLSQKELEVVGLDISTGLIDQARKRHPHHQFVVGSMLSLPFNDTSFDGVWSHASLVHLATIDDVVKALSEFNRVLKPQGVVHLLVKAQTGAEKTAIVSDTLSGHERFFQYFTLNELQQLLANAGFSITTIEQYNETDRHPHGRAEVEWLLALAIKI